MPDDHSPVSRVARALVDSQRFRRQELPDIPVVRVTGDVTDDVITIRRTAVSALLLHGREAETNTEVIAPFAHLHLERFSTMPGQEERPETALKALLPFENAAYLVASLAADLRIACSQLAKCDGPKVPVERKRLEAARIMLSNAAHESLTAVAWISGMLEPANGEPAGDPRPRIQVREFVGTGAKATSAKATAADKSRRVALRKPRGKSEA